VATINSDGVRIPKSAREAVARHEEVVVLNHDRPVLLIINPDGRRSSAPTPRGRCLREAAESLLAAPLPDPDFALDLAAVIASVGPAPEDPWGPS
jgi:hypothetical protein